MIAFPSMLINPAKEAGMKIPADADNFEAEKDNFPHFFVYCMLQLGASMPSPSSHWENAKVIAAIPEDELKTMTAADFEASGFAIGSSSVLR